MTKVVSESIFDIFRKHKVPVNGVLYPRYISASIHLWEQHMQDQFEEEMQELVQEGFIHAENETYRLTQKGYDHIYRNYSLEDTLDIILSDFKRRRITKNEMLLLPALLSTLQDAERYHFDNYDKAIKSLSDKGWIISNGRGFILTEEGHDQVYSD